MNEWNIFFYVNPMPPLGGIEWNHVLNELSYTLHNYHTDHHKYTGPTHRPHLKATGRSNWDWAITPYLHSSVLSFNVLVSQMMNTECHMEHLTMVETEKIESVDETGTGVTPMVSGSQRAIPTHNWPSGSRLMNLIRFKKFWKNLLLLQLLYI